MAGASSIAAAGQSIVRTLNLCFDTDPPIERRQTQAVLVRTTDFQESQVATVMGANALSVYLYRVDFNKAMRAAWSAAAMAAAVCPITTSNLTLRAITSPSRS